MKKYITIALFVAVFSFVIAPLTVQAADLVVQWKGTGTAGVLPPGVGGDVVPVGTECVIVEMVDPRTGLSIGTGYDCIVGMTPVGDGLEVTTYYIFAFFKSGSIISLNTLTVQPVVDQGSIDAGMTHILGDFPFAGENTIQGGTKKFLGAEGNARVSGGVNLSNFPDTIEFDDLFVITLE